jgi:protein kinase A
LSNVIFLCRSRLVFFCLDNSPRAATCFARSACCVWKVGQKTFRYTLASSTRNEKNDLIAILRKVPFLSELEERHLAKVSEAFKSITFKEGERIINKGDIGKAFYIILDGSAKIHDIGKGDSKYVDQTVEPGGFFGERALVTGERRVANITATSTCTCLTLSRRTFEKVLGPLQDLINTAMRKRLLVGVPVFANSKFEPFELAQLTDMLVERTFSPGTVLAEQGKPDFQELFIIKSGSVAVAHDDVVIHTLREADYFGDKALKEKQGALSMSTITVQTETVCFALSKVDIEHVIGNLGRLGKPMEAAGLSLNKSVRMKDYTKRCILGLGSLGKVWMVTHKKTNETFALKQLSKHGLITNSQVEAVIREKNILASIDHPFVAKLVANFQDNTSVYLLMKFVQGGELLSMINSFAKTSDYKNGVPNGNARFYAGCILSALAYLHHRSITYRDLKPENVLIDKKGYCVLVDFGNAKVITTKTFTLCGSPEYLAPEIILSKGHDKGVDYWAFGVLVYEMLSGRTPFARPGKADEVGLFKRIMQVKFVFPPGDMISVDARDMIRKLLVRRLASRLGCLQAGEKEVWSHEWMKPLDADQIAKKEVPPPWVPKIKKKDDASFFGNFTDEPTNDPPLSDQNHHLFKNF